MIPSEELTDIAVALAFKEDLVLARKVEAIAERVEVMERLLRVIDFHIPDKDPDTYTWTILVEITAGDVRKIRGEMP